MKKLILIIFVLSFQLFVSQNKNDKNIGSISGIILDIKTKQPIPYATIICKNTHQKTVNGGITNNVGKFSIHNLPLDSLSVLIQYIGYKTITKTILLTKLSPNINFKTIYLAEETNNLDEVIVETETSEMIQKIDRKVFNVGKDLSIAGTNSLELLENIPSIQVDYQNGSINLRGNSNVRILIDGKPSLLSPTRALEQIPSSSIKSVEIITNPSAKYNPEGMSGIINIILKKNTTIGFNGSFSVGIQHSINTRPNASLNANYRVGKLNFYGNYSLDFGKFETFSFFDRQDKDLKQDINFLDDSFTNYGKIGLDYYIDDKNTLSFYTTQSSTNTDFYVDTKIVNNSNLIFDAKNLSEFRTRQATYNLDFKHNFSKKGEAIELEINYSKSTDPQQDFINENLNPIDKTNNYNNVITNNSSLFLTNIDYTKPIKNGQLELGLESRIQTAFNKINTTQEIQINANPTNQPKGNSELNYDRDIYAAYLNISKNYNKLSTQIGFRFEQFNLNGTFFNTQQANLEPVKDAIFSVYPSAYITYSPSDKNQFQVGYSRRVDRPGIGQVTPIQEWTSPLSISVGDRNLLPQFTNSFEFNYTKSFKKGYFTLGTFYRKTQDVIGRIFSTDVQNVDRQILSYANYNSAESYGFEFSSRLKLNSWWVFRPSTNLYIQDNQGLVNGNLQVANNTLFTARISNSFTATKKLRFSLSASYRGNNENVLTKIDDYFLVNVSARYKVLDGNGTITLRGTDIFDGYKLDFSTTNPFPQVGQFTLEYTSIFLGFTYNFGRGKNRERDRKYREENETQGSGGVL
jgi:outer membrane receptor protein involved in Fe transport